MKNLATFFACLSTLLSLTLQAQQPVVWAEDFSDSLSGWTVVGVSAPTALWKYTPNGAAGGAFVDATIGSATAANGAAIFDADFYTTGGTNTAPSPPYPQYHGELISPTIDLSSVSTPVSLRFTEMIAVLNRPFDLPRTSISVSLDNGTTWSDPIDANDDVGPNQFVNARTKTFPLAGLAGQSAVKLKFSFASDFYSWTIDDLELIERECNNIRINSNWVARPDNIVTPKSQVSPIHFMADIANIGGCEAHNVQLNVLVRRANVGVYQDSLAYGTITTDSIAENAIFPAFYEPTIDLKANYTLRYTLTSDSTDYDATDNSLSFPFIVSDSTFAKERGSTRTIAPGGSNWNATEKHSWGMGNYYFVPNGLGYRASTIQVGIANPQDFVDNFVTIKLYEIADEVAAPNTIATNERTLIAYNDYQISANDSAPLFVTVPLINLLDETQPIALQDNKGYLAMVEFIAPNSEDNTLALQACDTIDYGPAIYIAEQLGTPRFGPVLAIGNDDLEVDFSTFGFGRDIVPVVRLNIQPIIDNTQESLLSDANVLSVSPNPAHDLAALHINLTDVAQQAHLSVFDNSGKLVYQQALGSLQTQTLPITCKEWAAGVYQVQLRTERGHKTQNFVVQHPK